MTHEEYELVRGAQGEGTRFFVKPADAHVVSEAEDVVERHERYWVVEKVASLVSSRGERIRVRLARAASMTAAVEQSSRPLLGLGHALSSRKYVMGFKTKSGIFCKH